jgi:hypothetical protein
LDLERLLLLFLVLLVRSCKERFTGALVSYGDARRLARFPGLRRRRD